MGESSTMAQKTDSISHTCAHDGNRAATRPAATVTSEIRCGEYGKSAVSPRGQRTSGGYQSGNQARDSELQEWKGWSFKMRISAVDGVLPMASIQDGAQEKRETTRVHADDAHEGPSTPDHDEAERPNKRVRDLGTLP